MGLTLVELRRRRHLDSVDRTLSSGERHQSHRPVLVLKHAVLALQVQTVQDCRRNEITVSNAISLCTHHHYSYDSLMSCSVDASSLPT